MHQFDVIVIGGGIHGLATAYHLSNHRHLKIGLVEQFTMGHAYGSSHGFSRIFRTTYVDSTYTKLAKRANALEWPALEKTLGCKLLFPSSRCLFGSGTAFEKYTEMALKSHSNREIELLTISAACQRFPQFNFFDSSHVLHDHASKVIAAKDTMDHLTRVVKDRNIAIFDKTKVLDINSEDTGVRLRTSEGLMSSNRMVVNAGPWVKNLFPELKSQVCPIKQIVGYYSFQGEAERYQIGRFPIWVYFGEGKNNVFYGLPEFGCKGVKVAQDISKDTIDDPNAIDSELNENKIKILEKFIKTYFVDRFIKTEKIESCFYTTTPTDDFILDFFPKDNRIVIGSACSGHAFKFAPLTGRILSELILNGTTTIPEFEENKGLFAFKNTRQGHFHL